MIEYPAVEALGPPPFRFAPISEGLESPAFSLPFKLLTTLMVWGGVIWFTLLFAGMVGRVKIRSAAMVWFGAAALLMLATWWHIIRSRTRLTAEALTQTWLWNKRMELRELAYGKLIRVRGLDWLIAPRLYVRTLMGKYAVFYAADSTMIAEFEHLVKDLAAFRRMR